MAIQAGEHEEAGADERAADLGVGHDGRLGLNVRIVYILHEEDAEGHADGGGRNDT